MHNINEMTSEEIEARLAEIKNEIPEADGEKLAELRSELEAIEARKAEARAKAEERDRVAADETLKKIHEMPKEDRNMAEVIYDANSPLYRTAWLKDLATRKSDGKMLLGEMTKEERDAFTFTTTNSGSVVPTVTMNKIVELVLSMAPMYDDATKSGMASGFGVPRHKSIVAGDARVTNEGVANDDENDEFDILPISGDEIKKHVEITRKMKWLSIDAFEDWVVEHLSKRIAVAKEKKIQAALDVTTTGIAAGNIIAASAGYGYTDAKIRAILAKIKETGVKVWYANSNTIYNGLAGIQDTNGRPLFLASTEDSDPLVAGRIYGGKVKLDENLADDVVYVGVPKSILANDYEELFINAAIDPKTFKEVIGGYSLFGAGLENPLAFVKVTFVPTT